MNLCGPIAAKYQEYQHLFIADAVELRLNFQYISFQHVKRNANSLAHALAKLGLSTMEDNIWMEGVPSTVQTIAVSNIQFISISVFLSFF